MKKYKELANFLKESEYTATGTDPVNTAYSDSGVYRIEDKAQLGKINAFIHAFTQREFVDPRQAMSQLRHKLNFAGLDFELPKVTDIDEGTENYKLTRSGGEFGTKPDHDLSKGFYKSDGISPFNDGVGMVLRTTYNVSESGLYKIDAMIVPDTDEDEEDI